MQFALVSMSSCDVVNTNFMPHENSVQNVGEGEEAGGVDGAWVGARFESSRRTKEWKLLRRGMEWKSRWLHLRITYAADSRLIDAAD